MAEGGGGIYLPVMGSFRGFGASILKQSRDAARNGARAMADEYARGGSKAGKGAAKALADGLSGARGEVAKAASSLARAQDVVLDRQGRVKVAAKQAEAAERSLAQARRDLAGATAQAASASSRASAAAARSGESSKEAARAERELASARAAQARAAKAVDAASTSTTRAQERSASASRAQARAEEDASAKSLAHEAALERLGAAQSGAAAETTKLARAQSGLSGSLSKVGKAALGAFAFGGIVGGLHHAVTAGIGLTNALNTLRAVTEATGETMARARSEALRLGTDVTIPATSSEKAAEAMVELSKGGFSVEQAMKAARGTLQLAAAAHVDAAQAAEIQANALNTFGLNADQAVKAADVLANAANASSVEIQDVAYALQSGGAVAAQYGISMRDAASAIGLLGNAGIKGSDAGTLLKTALIHLANPSKQAKLALDELRVSAWDAQGRFTGLPAVFEQLRKASERLTPELYAQDAAIALGTDAARLAGVAAREGGAGFDKMAVAVDRNGTAMRVASARTEGLGGAWNKLVNSGEEVALLVYGLVEGPLTSFVNAIGDTVDAAVRLALTLSGHKAAAESAAAVLGVLAAALAVYNVQQGVAAGGGLAAMMTRLAAAAGTAALAMLGLDAAMLANPITWIVVAVAALVGAFVYLWNTSEGFRDFWKGLWAGVQSAFSAVWGWLKGVWTEWAGYWNGALFPVLKMLWDSILKPAFDGVKNGVRVMWAVVSSVFKFWSAFFTGVVFPLLRFFWHQVVEPVWNGVSNAVAQAWQTVIKPALDSLWSFISDTLAPVFLWLWHEVVEPAWNGLGAAITSVIDKVVKPAFEGLKKALSMVGDFFGTVVEGIKVAWDKIKEYAAKPINFVIQTVWNDGLAKAWNKIADFVPGLVRAQVLDPVKFARGGHVKGPGTSTSDSIPAMLSNDEHVWDALDVSKAGGQGVMYAMRAAVSKGVPFTWDAARGLVANISPDNLAKLGQAKPGEDGAGLLAGTLPGFKDGGAVIAPAWQQQLARAHEWARSRSRRPYVLGGSADGDGGTDCSGFMSGIADVIGGGTGHRQWATMAFNGGGNTQAESGPQGFKAGLSANTLSIGVKNGGAAGGHTAGTLGGAPGFGATNVESGGSHGDVMYGGSSAGADHPQFPTRYHLPIGPDGAFVSVGQGADAPAPEQQHGFIRDRVKQVVHSYLDPIKDAIGGQFGAAPPWWNSIPANILDKTVDGAVDGAFAVANGLTSTLRSSYDAASAAVSGMAGGSAAPVSGPLLRDSGGPLPKGDTWVRNNTGREEWVLTDEQWRRVREMMAQDHLAKDKAVEAALGGGKKTKAPAPTSGADTMVQDHKRSSASGADNPRPEPLGSFQLARERSDASTSDDLAPGESTYSERTARAPDKAGAANQSGSAIDWGAQMLSQGADAIPGLVQQAISTGISAAADAAAGTGGASFGGGAGVGAAAEVGKYFAEKGGQVAGMWAAHGIKSGINIARGVIKDAADFVGFGYDEFTDPYGVFRQVAGQIDGVGQGQESTNQQNVVAPGAQDGQLLADQSVRGESQNAQSPPRVSSGAMGAAPAAGFETIPSLASGLGRASAAAGGLDPVSAQLSKAAPKPAPGTGDAARAAAGAPPVGSVNPSMTARPNALWGEGAPGGFGSGAQSQPPDVDSGAKTPQAADAVSAATGGGADASGAADPDWVKRLGVYDSGGTLPHGSLALNTSGHDEYVVPPGAWSNLDDILKGKVSTGDKGVDADIAEQMGRVMKERGKTEQAGSSAPAIHIDAIHANDPAEAAREMSKEARRLSLSNSLVGGR